VDGPLEGTGDTVGHTQAESGESYRGKSPFVKWDNGLTGLKCLSPLPYLWLVTSRPFLAVVQYDGGQFVGWQRQSAGRTVQAEFEAVLERLAGEPTTATGAGRTDTGVHAVGQGVGFRVAERWGAEGDGLRRALNAMLPRDIWVERVHAMREEFHARRSATARRYRYEIGTDDASHSPFRRPFEWALGRPLDLGLLAEAAGTLPGTHDFRGLAAAGAAKPDYRCRVALASWAPRADGAGVTFTIESDRFLHRMVRFLVGTMVDIALRRRPLPDLPQLLTATDNEAASPPAPPQGLYLELVRYPSDLYAEAHT
jgi:tRNA pseudouridine38-40 synthase